MFDARLGVQQKEGPAIWDEIRRECSCQEEHIEPTASENDTSSRGVQ